MSWWHSDIDTWAGTDGTDLYKPYVDIINAVHERYESLGWYTEAPEDSHGIPGASLQNLKVNTNRNAVDEPVYGTKAAPLDYEDILGVPLNGEFFYMGVAAVTHVGRLYQNNLLGHPSVAGWAKSPSWDGEDPDGVWWRDTIEEELGTLFESASGYAASPGVFFLPEVFKYLRRVLELLIYPITFFRVTSGMTWPEDWIQVNESYTTWGAPSTPTTPVDIGTIYRADRAQFNYPNTLQNYSSHPRTNSGYMWSGGFTSPQFGFIRMPEEQVVAPGDALALARTFGFLRDERDPIQNYQHYPPMSIFKETTGPNVTTFELKIIAIPPGFRGEFGWDRGPVVHSLGKYCQARGQQTIKLRTSRIREYQSGDVLKEFMYFFVNATDCPVVSWTIGGSTVSVPRADLTTPSIGGPSSNKYYPVSGVMHPGTSERVVSMSNAEDMDENPFDGVYDQWHVANAADTVYILRERVTMRGFGRKRVGVTPNSTAFAIVDMSYAYV